MLNKCIFRWFRFDVTTIVRIEFSPLVRIGVNRGHYWPEETTDEGPSLSRRNVGSVRTIRRTTILRRSIDNEAATSHTGWRSLQEEGPPHDRYTIPKRDSIHRGSTLSVSGRQLQLNVKRTLYLQATTAGRVFKLLITIFFHATATSQYMY